jgi:hypothetical protein
MTANFMVVTVAACESAYAQEALGHVGTFVRELKDKANCVSARYGVMGTGADAGSLVLFQSYASLADVEKVFEVYAASSAYQAVITSGKVSVTLRNIVKLDDVQLSNPSSNTPSYGVVTLVSGSSLTSERMKSLVPIFEQNGAMVMRFGTLITGSNAGKRLLGVAYPSMAAIEKTYDALRASADYQSLLSEVKLERREIVRFVG